MSTVIYPSPIYGPVHSRRLGLSLGITPGLGTASRLVLIALMFFGRVGGLTLIFATLPANKNTLSKLPLEKITVG